MNIKRRDFIKASAAAGVLLLPGIAIAMEGVNAISTPTLDVYPQIEKSIKASFGGGFSVRAHTQSNGLTYADIEHFGNRYAVTSSNLLDWNIVSPL